MLEASANISPVPILLVDPRSTAPTDEDVIDEVEEVEVDDTAHVRRARVGAHVVELYGRELAAGDRLIGDFVIPPARGTREPLTAQRMRNGLVLMTTLPNIHKHACAAQIVQTELLARTSFPGAMLVHVASDEPAYWTEIDRFHGDIQAPGYSLQLSSDADVFRSMFGVGVRGSSRIARGLFSFYRGVVLAADVPVNQMRTPDVKRFVERTRSLLCLSTTKEIR